MPQSRVMRSPGKRFACFPGRFVVARIHAHIQNLSHGYNQISNRLTALYDANFGYIVVPISSLGDI